MMNKSSKIVLAAISIAFLLFAHNICCAAGLPVFSGAEGFGSTTPAARSSGARIIRVTNLDDSGNGSLREALTTSGPRYVVFEVSGTITLNSGIKIDSPYLYVAGETAPSPGITIKGDRWSIDTHDVVVRHIRFRMGTKSGLGADVSERANMHIGTNSAAYNIVLDHCSFSWSAEKLLEIWHNAKDITVSNCIFSEALSNNPDDYCDASYCSGKAVIIGNAKNLSFLANLWAHNEERNPYCYYGAEIVMLNNLFYNVNYLFTLAHSGGGFKGSFVENKMIPGKDTRLSSKNFFLITEAVTSGQIYLENNFFNNELVTSVKWLGGDDSEFTVDQKPIWWEGLTRRGAGNLEQFVLANAGARPADRDLVDERIVKDVQNRTGHFISDPIEVGAWPKLAQKSRRLIIPDNPNDDDDGNGYTNIEEWLRGYAFFVEVHTKLMIY